MGRKAKATAARCPECYSLVRFQKVPRIGYTTTCRECHSRLEVVESNPLELDWASEASTRDDHFYDYSYSDKNKFENEGD